MNYLSLTLICFMSGVIYSDGSAGVSLFQVADFVPCGSVVVISLHVLPILSLFSRATAVPTWCVGAQAVCSLGSNICHSEQVFRLAGILGIMCPAGMSAGSRGVLVPLCPGSGDVAAVLHVLWGLVACRRVLMVRPDGRTHRSASSLKGCSAAALVQTDAQSPQPAAPPESLGPSCVTYHLPHFILDHHLVILLTLGQKGQLLFYFQKNCL